MVLSFCQDLRGAASPPLNERTVGAHDTIDTPRFRDTTNLCSMVGIAKLRANRGICRLATYLPGLP